MKIKLQEYLKRHGYASSNSSAKKLIRDHIVTVHGVRVKSCSIQVPAEKNVNVVHVQLQIMITETSTSGSSSGSSAQLKLAMEGNENDHPHPNPHQPRHQQQQQQQRFCIALNKPCGMICTLAADANSNANADANNNNINQEQTKPSSETSNQYTNTYTNKYPTLRDITPSIPEDYKPVGRLDQHSHGLLLFSLDGRLTSALLSPKTGVERTYRIVVRGDVGDVHHEELGSGLGSESASSSQSLERYHRICNMVSDGVDTDYGRVQGRIITMERDVGKDNYQHAKCGIGGGNRNDRYDNDDGRHGHGHGHGHGKMICTRRDVDGTMSNPDQDSDPKPDSDPDPDPILSRITVVVKEGKKRMVRRLFAAIGLFVVDLERIRYGEIQLDAYGLQPGQWTYLNDLDHKYCRDIVQGWETNGAGWDKLDNE